jgi:HSP20 family protein
MYRLWMLPGTDLVTEPRADRASLAPAADILDDGDTYRLILELPGVRQEDLTLSVEGHELRVRAVRTRHDASARLLHDGRCSDLPFARRFTLGAEIDRSRVAARLENGLLQVDLPRLAAAKKRVIPVEIQETKS